MGKKSDISVEAMFAIVIFVITLAVVLYILTGTKERAGNILDMLPV